jgi:hypothetical protein
VNCAGRAFIWVKTTPDPDDSFGYRIYAALDRACEIARKKWIALSWDTGALSVVEPRPDNEIKEEPHWPTGQTLEELYELAIKTAFIDNPNHPVIRRLDTISHEV